MKRFLLLLVAFFALNLLSPQVTAQCPMCKTSLEANRKDNKNAVGNGINNGILYLLAMPFIMVGGVAGLYIYRNRKTS
jgi:hypothetical protein